MRKKSKRSAGRKGQGPANAPESTHPAKPDDGARETDDATNESDTTARDEGQVARRRNGKTSRGRSGRNGSMLSRYVSFFMLVVSIGVFGFFFFNVIRGFLLPLFLATLLAVMFRPFHEGLRLRLGKHDALAAALATLGIMAVVLVPLAALVSIGVFEANQLIRNRADIVEGLTARVEETRRAWGLQKPFAKPLGRIETELRQLDDLFERAAAGNDQYLLDSIQLSRETIESSVALMRQEARATSGEMWSFDAPVADYARALGNQRQRELQLAQAEQRAAESTADGVEAAEQLQAEVRQANQLLSESVKEVQRLEAHVEDLAEGRFACEVNQLVAALHDVPELSTAKDRDWEPEVRALTRVLQRKQAYGEPGFLELIDSFADRIKTLRVQDDEVAKTRVSTLALAQSFAEVQAECDVLRTALLGGPIWGRIIEALNPGSDLVNEWITNSLTGSATRWLPSITNTATSLLARILVGLGIMAVALFYFFLDGAKMITAAMHLSPLDDDHERELLEEFDRVSRAVVLATVLAAVAQGVLGAIGYRLVGMQSVFLLSLLTMVLALIPFVGAAAIWLPCCLFLAFVQEPSVADGGRNWLYAKAAFLFVYGVTIISMADNIIKPWVLQGQSKLHPLLALLSVLGGVQALGPIGILVGPMVVAFLQVLLTILEREISALDAELQQRS